MSIQVDHVTKRFGAFTVLNDVNLHVQSGELIALLGPSGCGKTTLLRILAGLERPDQGRIVLHGTEVTDQRITERQVGFVFQHYALFRHMTVADNVAFGLTVKPRSQRPSTSRIQEKVRELLTLVQLQAMADRYPSQLSGGQRQRVALARALAVEPKLLLLDEPFGALDAKVRKELRRWLRRLHDELHITGILVTHDQEEALEVADRVVVMHQGNVEQIGTPDEVYENPATPFVYQFLGDVNVFHGRLSHGRMVEGEDGIVRASGDDLSNEQEVTFVRPHDLELSPSRTMPEQLEAMVQFVNAAGARVHLELESKESPGLIVVELTKERYRELKIQQGDVVFIHPKQLHVFKVPSSG
ncbi:sulfate/thiosulfate transporter subunit; ATP-binding component of ABC superfamily [Candidatus Nitrospira nitrosa]|uniref:Sulfate/thiosulfate transporter subunit ATP-binding component of ABC superfamily n=1 Tax=Candidatus Nitrospira nitrosa TaxID=1742972 RepID=A0A0S4LLN7_9BACT|nr:sulfate ABC transporter ATP-binding protein [Candidatus Nitrospira nitrosa]CUS38503.1 sulfate/thiosulfate transporter subunit; ATP-binding component of ABC superfamily [Candidatus Nitrospira nitrosa]